MLSLLSACAITPQKDTSDFQNQRPIQGVNDELEISKFSSMPSQGENISSASQIQDSNELLGWHLWDLAPHKKKTQYHLRKYQGKTVIHAEADSSASGLIVALRPKNVQGLDLTWSWKALKNIALADNTQGHVDDAPLRLVLGFEGDKSKLSLSDQLAFDMAKLISGHDLPYATLMYIWSEKSPREQIITNKRLSRIKAIVVDSGSNQIGQWRVHRRHIEEDFRRAYGENPGKLIALGIMTDSDNTKSQASAIYGDIELTRQTTKKAKAE